MSIKDDDGTGKESDGRFRKDGLLSSPVLVLNANFEPLNVVAAKRALVLVLKGRAELVKAADGTLVKASRLSLPLPSVVRLMSYAHRPPAQVRLNRKSILLRDDYSCQYCGYRGPGLTIDHVIPRDMGGGHDWDNLVACCSRCNAKKGNRTPEQAAMTLLRRPRKPAFLPHMGYVRLVQALKNPDWKEFFAPFVKE
ncbi:MAG: HNH endonuclease [Armatimonadetes bacterium]|nr:HNH endonuclease [Armatimonadota bacterium]MDW8121600.1 HNH endonuclease [Armatimonadota bacterium]